MTSVLDGPRREIRRIFHQGSAQWVSVSDDGAEPLPRLVSSIDAERVLAAVAAERN